MKQYNYNSGRLLCMVQCNIPEYREWVRGSEGEKCEGRECENELVNCALWGLGCHRMRWKRWCFEWSSVDFGSHAGATGNGCLPWLVRKQQKDRASSFNSIVSHNHTHTLKVCVYNANMYTHCVLVCECVFQYVWFWNLNYRIYIHTEYSNTSKNV